MAVKMWRPPNWDILKPIPYNPKDGESAWDFYEHGVEAGADAMLEALFELARESPTKEFIIDSKEHHIYAKGE